VSVAQPVIAAPPSNVPVAQTDPGRLAIALLVSIGFVVVPLLLYALWEFWPTQAIVAAKTPQRVHMFGITRNVSTEIRFFAIVAIAGALGGVMHSTRSLAWYVGNDGLKWRWVPYYVLTIVLGAGLASVFYLVVRGGLFGGQATSTDLNPYGIAAVAALVGLFTEQALVMLKKVAGDVFAPSEKGNDPAPDPSSDTTTNAGESAPDTTGTTLTATTGTATYVEPTSATLEGDVGGDGEPPSFSFEYGKTTTYGLSTNGATAPAAAAHVTTELNGLQAATEYHFRLVAKTADGLSATGEDATFTTPAA
jgi:hypothetical protein